MYICIWNSLPLRGVALQNSFKHKFVYFGFKTHFIIVKKGNFHYIFVEFCFYFPFNDITS